MCPAAAISVPSLSVLHLSVCFLCVPPLLHPHIVPFIPNVCLSSPSSLFMPFRNLLISQPAFFSAFQIPNILPPPLQQRKPANVNCLPPLPNITFNRPPPECHHVKILSFLSTAFFFVCSPPLHRTIPILLNHHYSSARILDALAECRKRKKNQPTTTKNGVPLKE